MFRYSLPSSKTTRAATISPLINLPIKIKLITNFVDDRLIILSYYSSRKCQKCEDVLLFSLSLGWLVGKKKQSEDVTFGFGKLKSIFHNFRSTKNRQNTCLDIWESKRNFVVSMEEWES